MTGSDVRKARLALGLTQRQLAEQLGVTANTVARWERDEVAVGNPVLVQARLEQLLTDRMLGAAKKGKADRG